MKTRRHHNNKGTRQIKRGKTRKLIAKLKRELVKVKEREDGYGLAA